MEASLHKPTTHRTPIAAGAIAWALIMIVGFAACSPRPPAKAPLQALFDEGRDVFYQAVDADVARHPDRGRLTAAERAKIAGLKDIYPRVYGLMVNYFYPKDAPVFDALLAEGSEASMGLFREKYLDLVRSSARMFSDSLFSMSPVGLFFKDLIPRFKDQDTVDMVVMETGNMANIDLPAPEKIVPKTLSPEFEKQWGLDAARFREAHRLTKGRGVRVAVLDTGIDMTHPVFRDTAWGRHFNFVGRDGLPWVESGPPMVDWGWHGTVVSSIVAKYAPEARITVYRYLDGDSQNDSPFPIIVSSNMGAAIYKAVHDGNDVINISAGTNLDVPYLEEACRYAWDNNVIIVTGSAYYQGRYLGGAEDYPAQYPTTIAATALDRLAENKYGYWPIAAPDPLTDVGAPNAPFVAFPAYSGETDVYAPGISCATPIVASAAALAVSAYPRLGTEPPGQYVEAIRKLLSENANSRMVGFDGFAPECGFGMVDAMKTVEAAQKLGAARPARGAVAIDPARGAAPSTDAVFAAGEVEFHKRLRVALGLHPERDRLLPAEIEKIEGGPAGIPFLYENLIDIVFWRSAPGLLELRAKNEAAFRDRYLALCREAADRFVDSLFVESPSTRDLLQAPENIGRGRLDLVLSSLGRAPRDGRLLDRLRELKPGFLDDNRALGSAKFSAARKPAGGQGIKVAVIDSGCDLDLAASKMGTSGRVTGLSLVNGTRAPWDGSPAVAVDADGRGTLMTMIAGWCAPGAEIRTYGISAAASQPYEYWPALELAQALYKAADDGCDVVITGAAFSRDFEFLKEACRSVYLRNVIIIAPNGLVLPGSSREVPAYPAAYNTVIAVAGAGDGTGPGLKPWASSAPAKETAVTGPAFAAPGLPPSNAYAAGACGGLAALLSPEVPRTGKELPGQFVQRIAEILKTSADPKALGYGAFNVKIGYGFIDAAKTLGTGLQTYVKKMNQLDDEFKKRMARRAQQAEDAAKREAEMKQPPAGKK
jgi:hypothetical protein